MPTVTGPREVVATGTGRPFESVREPFSRGVLRRSLVAAGLEQGAADRCALDVGESLASVVVTRADVAACAARWLDEQGVATVSRRYAGLRALRERGTPLALLVGGASGTGKSTIALEVARRCGIDHVTPTDVVRRSLRRVYAGEPQRAIHHESFDVPGDDAASSSLAGFANQAQDVLVAVHAIVEHALLERWPIVLEGVHLVPGQWPGANAGVMVEVVVTVHDEERHRANFSERGEQTAGGRPADHYLRNFERVRGVQHYLEQAAASAGALVVDSHDPDAAVLAIIDAVLDAAFGQAPDTVGA